MCSAAWRADDLDHAATELTAELRAEVPAALAEAQAWMVPAGPDDFSRSLGPTLALVAPAGMTEDDQVAWLAAAVETMNGIPCDLLDLGCKAARTSCDHPSKLVKAIFDAAKPEWDRRRANLNRMLRISDATQRIALPEEDRCTPEQAAAIMAEFGFRSNAA